MDAALFAIRFSTAAFMIVSCIIAKLLFKDNKICYILFFSTSLCNKWNMLIKLVAGAAIPFIIITIIYGKPFIWSIYVALFRDSNYIAPNGLNVGWIVKYFYEAATNSLSNGQISIMWSVPIKALISFKYVFMIGYVFIFFRSLLAKKLNISDILRNSLKDATTDAVIV